VDIYSICALNPNKNDFDSPDEGFTPQNKISRSDKSAGSWGLEDQANKALQLYLKIKDLSSISLLIASRNVSPSFGIFISSIPTIHFQFCPN
jgi:hypothetical protein